MLEEKACFAVSAVCDDALITKVFCWVDDDELHIMFGSARFCGLCCFTLLFYINDAQKCFKKFEFYSGSSSLVLAALMLPYTVKIYLIILIVTKI